VSDAFRLKVRVTPSARRNGFDGWMQDADGDDRLKVTVTTAPEKGKANKSVQKLVAKSLGVASGSVQVVQGETARLKTLQIAGNPVETAQRVTEIFGEPGT
jgi:uncharacterized protein (TIGR00251 family)